MSKSSKRGMSLDEKREKMLEIFHESQSFYQLKELEKLGPKKGVISQSVKDVIQTLVNDDLVFKDKIGTSIYFWSLPSSAGHQLRHMYEKLQGELVTSNERVAELQKQLEISRQGREDSEERETALMILKNLQTVHNSLQEELDLYSLNDPARVQAMKNSTEVAKDAVNRWTENVLILQQWCSKTFPEAKHSLEQLYDDLGITENFDVLD